jgi:hypothetical protein
MANNNQHFNVISAKEIKTLERLTHGNICACENFIRSANAEHNTLPLISWMTPEIYWISGVIQLINGSVLWSAIALRMKFSQIFLWVSFSKVLISFAEIALKC